MDSMLTLRGIVLSKFKTIGEFADAIGWKRSKASRILNGVQVPDVVDAQKMAESLEIDSAELFMQIFFHSLSTKWTNSKSA